MNTKNRPSKYGVNRENFASEREYRAAYMKAYRQTPKGVLYKRKSGMKAKGITEEVYQEMLIAQDGKCAVCGTTDPGGNRWGKMVSFNVDHDQKCCPGDKTCGKCVRGLLCGTCNRGEGLIKDFVQELTEYKARYAENRRHWDAADKREALFLAHK